MQQMSAEDFVSVLSRALGEGNDLTTSMRSRASLVDSHLTVGGPEDLPFLSWTIVSQKDSETGNAFEGFVADTTESKVAESFVCLPDIL